MELTKHVILFNDMHTREWIRLDVCRPVGWIAVQDAIRPILFASNGAGAAVAENPGWTFAWVTVQHAVATDELDSGDARLSAAHDLLDCLIAGVSARR